MLNNYEDKSKFVKSKYKLFRKPSTFQWITSVGQMIFYWKSLKLAWDSTYSYTGGFVFGEPRVCALGGLVLL